MSDRRKSKDERWANRPASTLWTLRLATGARFGKVLHERLARDSRAFPKPPGWRRSTPAVMREDSMNNVQGSRGIQSVIPGLGEWMQSTVPVDPAAAASVTVTAAEDFEPEQRAFLDSAGLDDFAPLEAWTINGSNRQMGYSTHGIFRYFGKFPPPIARRLIEEFTVVGDLVDDPMCGSGTTGVEALLTGRRAALSDVNPLSVLLSRVKTTHASQEALLNVAIRVVRRAQKIQIPVSGPIGLRNPDHWFLPETMKSLGQLRDAIDVEPEGIEKDFLLLCFAAVVRRASRATTQQGRLFLDVTTAVGDALPLFERQVQKASEAIGSIPANEGQVTVANADVLAPERAVPTGAALSIMHPPYFNMYKYSSVNSLELAWLGTDQKDVRRSEIREFFKIGKPENVARYLEDMELGLRHGCARVEVGGAVGLMIGDTRIGGEHIRVVRPLLEALPEGIKAERMVVRIPKYTEATWAASQRRKSGDLGARLFDLIVILRKTS